MDDVKEVMSDIYNTLVQIRYPKITTATVENVETTILSGKNRISLLSWVLAEKSPEIAVTLQNLGGTALKDKLLQYYSGIGICTDKELLMGNCALKEQLPTLKLLLEFIKCMYIDSSDTEDNEEKCIDDIIQACIIEDPDEMISDIDEDRQDYSESLQYFHDLKEYVANHQESNSDYESKKEETVTNNEEQVMVQEKEKESNKNDTDLFNEKTENFVEASIIETYPKPKEKKEENEVNTMNADIKDICSNVQEKEKESNENDTDLLFNEKIENFLEAFSIIETYPRPKEKKEENYVNTMDADIKDICSNFSILTQFLQAKDGICNASIPKELNKINTPFNEIFKDAVTNTTDAVNMYINNQ
ncbi:uncharacterized protein LOC122402324 [Colletes gigas]|uniref:uncharacterized protein LOC122402324 n=1 Tax=Colletes gigas TaxID=935657 RepID=UPI001C9B14AC|nr:uncharacterized protein LOC122402324 [Colletes gigas]